MVETFTSSPLIRLAAGAVVVALVLLVVMRLALTGPRRFKAGRVTGVTGRKRAGKSGYMIRQVLRHLRYPIRRLKWEGGAKVQGHVASNFTLTLPDELATDELGASRWHPIRDWSDIFTPATMVDGELVPASSPLPWGTLVFLDEAHVWFPKTPGMVLHHDVSDLLSMVGKVGLEVFWVTQSADNVAGGLKAQTDVMMRVRQGAFWRIAEAWDVDEFGKKSAGGGRPVPPLFRERFRMTDKIGAVYQTYEFISPPLGGLLERAPRTDTASPRASGGGRSGGSYPRAVGS